VTAALVALSGPLATAAAAALVLALGVHVAAGPVVAVSRALLDLLDAGGDRLAAAVLQGWGAAWGWSLGQVEAASLRAASAVDIPEKMAAVHLVGLLLEGAMLVALVPRVLEAGGYAWPRPGSPRGAWQGLVGWVAGLTPWARAERLVVTAVVVAGAWAAATEARLLAVGWLARGGVDVPWRVLSTLGESVAWGSFVVVLVAVGVPLVGVDVSSSSRAGRTRRLAWLATGGLLLAAGVGALS
jgi:hypothetical protein